MKLYRVYTFPTPYKIEVSDFRNAEKQMQFYNKLQLAGIESGYSVLESTKLL